LFVGPVFTREIATAPRHWRLYFSRAVYVGSLFLLVCTVWLILFGSQPLYSLGDMARFGAAVFALISPVQLALAVGFAALLTAAAVAQEKDRRTLDLLLMTRMTNSELVIGKLLASMLSVLVFIVASVPLLMLLALLGGVSHQQVARVTGVTLTAALAAGSLGSVIALWREKTFQTLAMTALALMVWLLLGEAVSAGLFGDSLGGAAAREWGQAISPLRAIGAAAQATTSDVAMLPAAPWLGDSPRLFMILSAALAVLLNLIAIARVRVWNPTRETRPATDEESPEASEAAAGKSAGRDIHAAPGRTRTVWDNPILWREICTWAYGKKVVVVRLAYLAIFAACAVTAFGALKSEAPVYSGTLPAAVGALTPLFALGLVLINALAVTSLTNERDSKALDLLLVTDLTPKEIIFGKLGGILYNAKEMIVLPALLCLALWSYEHLSAENLVFVLLCLATLNAFVAMLGVHAGMTYPNSRTAVGVSLGTLLFLLLGVAVCMRMMIAFQASFDKQFLAFAAFMLGGGLGLFLALGRRNPSQAIWWASILAPIATFYVISTFLRSGYGAAALVTIAMYGYATAALLIPAVFEFDIATGRTTAKDI
jgi:ABC-type transport system involved in multi-copper enzyme maturation permease subunit